VPGLDCPQETNRGIADIARTERPIPTNRQISDVASRQENWPIVQVEQHWRVYPKANEAAAEAPSDAAVTAWATPSQPNSVENSVEGSDTSATLTYLRSQAAGEFWVAGRRVFDGRMRPQTLVIENSAEPKRSVCRGPTSMFRVYLPQGLLAESYEHATGRPPDTEIVLSDFAVLTDTAVEKLVQVLVHTDNCDEAFGRVYLDRLGLAIASRLIALHLYTRGSSGARGALAKWRLKRAFEHIDAALDGPISLRELANAAGLTRMHIAAQSAPVPALVLINTFQDDASHRRRNCCSTPSFRSPASRLMWAFRTKPISRSFSNKSWARRPTGGASRCRGPLAARAAKT
jgi:AraC family transcriptional regulator